jgi:hypothetical protein
MMDRDNTTRAGARTPGVERQGRSNGGARRPARLGSDRGDVFMAPTSTKGRSKLRRTKGMPGAGLTGGRSRKALPERPALKPYWLCGVARYVAWTKDVHGWTGCWQRHSPHNSAWDHWHRQILRLGGIRHVRVAVLVPHRLERSSRGTAGHRARRGRRAIRGRCLLRGAMDTYAPLCGVLHRQRAVEPRTSCIYAT